MCYLYFFYFTLLNPSAHFFRLNQHSLSAPTIDGNTSFFFFFVKDECTMRMILERFLFSVSVQEFVLIGLSLLFDSIAIVLAETQYHNSILRSRPPRLQMMSQVQGGNTCIQNFTGFTEKQWWHIINLYVDRLNQAEVAAVNCFYFAALSVTGQKTSQQSNGRQVIQPIKHSDVVSVCFYVSIIA